MKYILASLIFLTHLCIFADPLNWGPPESISDVAQDASEPRIGIDENGNLVAAWIENGVVKAKTKSLNAPWEQDSASVSEHGASSLELVVAPSGDATAIWCRDGVIETASLPFQENWQSPVVLSATGASAPQISVNSSGNLAAIWICDGIIQASIKSINGNWPSLPDDLSLSLAFSDSPQICLGDSGIIVAVWHSINGQIDTIYAASSVFGEPWSDAIAISNLSDASLQPKVAVDVDGNATAIWYRYTYANRNYSDVFVQSAFLPFNGSWTEPLDLSDEGFWDPNELVAAVKYNLQGRPIVMWNNSSNHMAFDIQATVLVGDGWSSPINLLSTNLYAYDLDLQVSANGYAFGVYMLQDKNTLSPVIQAFDANTYSSFINIGKAQVISASGSNGYPRIAGTFDGITRYSGVVWLSFDGTNNTVQTAFGAGTVLAPPTNLSVVGSSNDLGVFTEYCNTISWGGASASLAGGFLIYRNDTLIGSGIQTIFTFTDHNQQEGEAVTYGVAFLEYNGDQTAVTTIDFP